VELPRFRTKVNLTEMLWSHSSFVWESCVPRRTHYALILECELFGDRDFLKYYALRPDSLKEKSNDRGCATETVWKKAGSPYLSSRCADR
jgi:hypothetical protein